MHAHALALAAEKAIARDHAVLLREGNSAN